MVQTYITPSPIIWNFPTLRARKDPATIIIKGCFFRTVHRFLLKIDIL
jgi:hypothetical protein